MTKTPPVWVRRVALKSLFAFAMLLVSSFSVYAQTQPDDDDGFINILTAIVAKQVRCNLGASVNSDAIVNLTATCTNSPTSYEWRTNGVLLATDPVSFSLSP